MQLQRMRESLALLLLALLPFHALLVTVLTKAIAGPGYAPLSWIAVWKEGLLALIVLIAFAELVLRRLRHRLWVDFDAVDGCITGLVAVAAVLGIYNANILSAQTAYGVRYDLLLPLCFLVFRRVAWTPAFRRRAVRTVVAAGILLVLWGILMMLLPMSALQTLGYSDLHSLFVSGGPLAPFQQIGETGIRRMQSAMSGPNQLGLWLLLPLSIVLVRKRFWLAPLFLLGIFLTFSRSAWIASAVITLLSLWTVVPREKRWSVFGSLAAAGAFVLAGIFAVQPEIVTRVTSNKNHIERPLHAISLLWHHPFGLGLGTAGPATNHLRETCVELPEGSDAGWASAHPDLCVFVGQSQVQPTDHVCDCPLLPENWFLQIGVELGVLGFLLYLGMIIALLFELRRHASIFLPFLGVCIAGLFLHSFEDFAVAATLWLLIAVSASQPPHPEQAPH